MFIVILTSLDGHDADARNNDDTSFEDSLSNEKLSIEMLIEAKKSYVQKNPPSWSKLLSTCLEEFFSNASFFQTL